MMIKHSSEIKHDTLISYMYSQVEARLVSVGNTSPFGNWIFRDSLTRLGEYHEVTACLNCFRGEC